MPFRQKFEALLAEGIDIVLCLRFNEAVPQLFGHGLY